MLNYFIGHINSWSIKSNKIIFNHRLDCLLRITQIISNNASFTRKIIPHTRDSTDLLSLSISKRFINFHFINNLIFHQKVTF